MGKSIRVKHIDMPALKVIWERVMYWYGLAREATIGGMALPWKKKQFRKNADDTWDKFEVAAEKIVADTIVTTGPEIERQQYQRKPPKSSGFKEAA